MVGADDTYDIDTLDDFEEQASSVGAEHLRSACRYMVQICQAAGVEMALLGGYSLALRGSSRRTVDIDIHVDVPMRRVKELLKDKACVVKPSFNTEGVYRIFVRVPADGSDVVVHAQEESDVGGDAQEESQEGEGQVVEVDFLPADGMMGGNINTEMIEADGLTVPVFDIPTMIINKLKSYDRRQSPNDLADIKWLLDTYEADITQLRDELDRDQCQVFLEALEEGGEDQDTIEKYRRILHSVQQTLETNLEAAAEPEAEPEDETQAATEPDPEPEPEPEDEADSAQEAGSVSEV